MAGILAVDLHVHAAVRRRRRRPPAWRSGPSHPSSRPAAQGHAGKVLHVAQRRAPLEQHHLEPVVEQASRCARSRNRRRSSAPCSTARTSSAALGAVDLDLELRQPRPNRLHPATQYANLPARALQRARSRCKRCAHPARSPPSAGSAATPSAVAGHVAHGDAARLQPGEPFGGPLEVRCPVSFPSPARWPCLRAESRAERLRCDHSFGHFVDRAVAARRHDQVRAPP